LGKRKLFRTSQSASSKSRRGLRISRAQNLM
jgi:hypothetical protein